MRSVFARRAAIRAAGTYVLLALLAPALVLGDTAVDMGPAFPGRNAPQGAGFGNSAGKLGEVGNHGALTYDVPIALPSQHGVTPVVSLAYSSHHGASRWLGYGWRLAAGGRIERRGPLGGVPRYDCRDRFELELEGHRIELERSSAENEPATFVTRHERFMRIRVHGRWNDPCLLAEGATQWELTTRDGTTRVFRSELPGPALDWGVAPRGWLLDEQVDTFGNLIVWEYQRDDDALGANAVYPRSVRWNARQDHAPAAHYALHFGLEPRTDAAPGYRAGVAVQMAQRISELTLVAVISGVEERLGSTRLSYDQSWDSGRSLLSTATQVGRDGGELPPVRFEYSSNEGLDSAWALFDGSEEVPVNQWLPGEVDFTEPYDETQSFDQALVLSAHMNHIADDKPTGTRFVDLDGDARPDAITSFVQSDPGVPSVWLNKPLPSRVMLKRLPNDHGLQAPTVLPGNPTGLMVVDNDITRVWARSTWYWGPNATVVAASSYAAQLVDLDGDGRTDIVEASEAYDACADAWSERADSGSSVSRSKVWLNGGDQWRRVGSDVDAAQPVRWSLPVGVYHGVQGCSVGNWPDWSEEESGRYFSALLSSSRRGMRLADINGDGLTDVLVSAIGDPLFRTHPYTQGSAWLRGAWLNDGDGNFEAAPGFTPPWYFLDLEGDPEAIQEHLPGGRDTGLRLVDLNSDGLPDLIRLTRKDGAPDLRSYWLNTGRGWSDIHEYRGDGTCDGSAGQTEACDPPAPGSRQVAWLPPHVLQAYKHWSMGIDYVDLNGDGQLDLVQALRDDGQSRRRTWLGRAQGWLADGREAFTAPTDTTTKRKKSLNFGNTKERRENMNRGVAFVDLDGDGVADLLRSKRSNGKTTHEVWMNRAQTPDLLTGVVEPSGGRSRFAYRSSAEFPNTRVPVNRPLISAIYRDATGRNEELEAQFVYEDGVHRRVGGTYRLLGYARVTTLRPRRDGSYDVEQREYYADEARAGTVYRERIGEGIHYDHERRPQIVRRLRTITHTDEVVSDGAPFLSQRVRTTTHLHRPEPQSPDIAVSTFEYDTYGNVIREQHGNEYAGCEQRVIERGYYRDEEAWVLARPRWEQVGANCTSAATWQRTDYVYDGGSHPTRGELSQETVSGTGLPQALITRYNLNAWGAFVSDPYGRRHSVTTPLGHRSEIEYDPLLADLPTAENRAKAWYTAQGYHGISTPHRPDDAGPFGSLAWTRDEHGVTTSYHYDEHGRLLRVTEPGDEALSWGSQYYGYSFTTGHPRSNLLLVSRTLRHDGSDATAELDTQAVLHDGFLRPWWWVRKVGQDQAVIVRAEYDVAGRVIGQSAPAFEGQRGAWSELERDALGRLTSVRTESLLHGEVERSWRFEGATTLATDASGAVTTTVNDALGRPVRVVDAKGGVTRYQHDALGNIVETIDAAGSRSKRSYDATGNMLGMEDPNRGDWSWTYDAGGHLVEERDAEGRRRILEYDSLERLVREQHLATDGTTLRSDTLHYGGEGRTDVTGAAHPASTHDGNRLTAVRSAASKIGLWYDARGRAAREQRIVGGLDLSAEWSWSSGGLLESLQAPTGELLRFRYDRAGRVASVDGLLSEIRYDAAGRLLGYRAGKAIADFAYWPLSGLPRWRRVCATGTNSQSPGADSFPWAPTEPTSAWHDRIETWMEGAVTVPAAVAETEPLDPSCSMHIAFEDWDPTGDLRVRVDRIADYAEHFDYDLLHRLSAYESSDGVTHSYAYDAVGNLTARDAQTHRYGEGNAGPHALTSRLAHSGALVDTLSYDANGRLRSTGARSFAYDHRGHPLTLASAQSGTELSFLYDGRGQRLRRRKSTLKSSETTWYGPGRYERIEHHGMLRERVFVEVAGHRLAAIESRRPTAQGTTGNCFDKQAPSSCNDAVLQDCICRARPDCCTSDWNTTCAAEALTSCTSEVRYFHHDHLGSTALVTSTDGTPLEQIAYAPFGQSNATPLADRYLFTGQDWLAELEVYDYGARLYDPTLGRFLSPDPHYSTAGLPQTIDNPQRLNLYSYVLNNPLRYTDPTGACEVDTGRSLLDQLVLLTPGVELSGHAATAAEAAQRSFAIGDNALGVLYSLQAAGYWFLAGADMAAAAASVPIRAGATGARGAIKRVVTELTSRSASSRAGAASIRPGASTTGLTAPGARPPNLTPAGGGRRAAFREAKRRSGIPVSQQPSRVRPNGDRRGRRQPGRIYEYDVRTPGGDSAKRTIRDDAGGHHYGKDNLQNRGSHFNDDFGGHYDY